MAKMKLDGKMKKAGSANLQWPQLASAGGSLVTRDANGNVVGTVDPAKTTVVWSGLPAGTFTFAFPNPADTTVVKATNTGVAATGATITATFTNVDGSAAFPPAVSPLIDVPVGPAISAEINLSTPA